MTRNGVLGNEVSMDTCFGWDLGGVNLKLARREGSRTVSVTQIPCPALGDPSKFDRALEEALKIVGDTKASHAVTMTGELSDVFATRYEGVVYLVSLMRKAFGEAVRFPAVSTDSLARTRPSLSGKDVASTASACDHTLATSLRTGF